MVGLGGLGKTTLAYQMYQTLKDKFDCHAFVSVSRNPDMMKVLKTIFSDISGKECTTTEFGDLHHLIARISSFLQDKKYFIIVDDLWDSKQWETISYALIKNNCGSRIITTTRINEIAESCCFSHEGHIYELRPLTPKSSRRLFLKRIFGSEEGCPPYLTKVSDSILRKCDGLPLAIIAIAGLLARKAPTLDEWNKVEHSFGRALERQSDINRMVQILSMSYFDLPSHLRTCFLYLGMFAEEKQIEKGRLILSWIAEGFISEEQGFTQYEVGERCFNELINRNLVQPVITLNRFSVVRCQVHDTVLEFILSKAVEENFITLCGVPSITIDPEKKIRRLSIHRNGIGDGSGGIYSHARSVFVSQRNSDSSLSLQNFKHLRVLDLYHCRAIESHHLAHLGELFALRFLNLSGTKVHVLPEEVGKLHYLQTLHVRFTRIEELPSSVCRLTRLVTLCCEPTVRLPDGFGDMQALQQLGVHASKQSSSFAQELLKLTNLQRLNLHLDEFSKDLWSTLCTLGQGNLHYLDIVSRQKETCTDLLMEHNCLSSTPLGLKVLEFHRIEFPRVPKWICALDNLQELELLVKQLGVADFVLLGRLNALCSLILWVRNEVADRSPNSQGEHRVKVSRAHGFPSLMRFHVGTADCALGLLFEAGAMPKLQMLHLMFDKLQTGYLINGLFDFGIQHLPRLAAVKCYLGPFVRAPYRSENYKPKHPAWVALEKGVRSNPNHPKLSHLGVPFS